jgi:hypothetical protein
MCQVPIFDERTKYSLNLDEKIRPPIGVTYTYKSSRVEGGTLEPYPLPSNKQSATTSRDLSEIDIYKTV